MRFQFIVFLFLVFFSLQSFGQDPQFSQFYAAPLYNNPAFAGSIHGGRLAASYRNQWPALPESFVSYVASYDQYMHNAKSGIGAILMMDQAGTAGLRSFTLNGLYSYEIRINRNLTAKAGMSMGIGNRFVNEEAFLFRDQIDVTGDITQQTRSVAAQQAAQQQQLYFDIGAGGLLYNDRFWIGAAALHINEPNQTVLQDNAQLPARYNFDGGVIIPLESKEAMRIKRRRINTELDFRSITPVAIYKMQGRFDQFDAGAYLTLPPIVIGGMYRGLPIKASADESVYNHDAVVALLGLRSNNFSIGYSYDITISSLSADASGGAHEISITYSFLTQPAVQKERYKPIPCPKF